MKKFLVVSFEHQNNYSGPVEQSWIQESTTVEKIIEDIHENQMVCEIDQDEDSKYPWIWCGDEDWPGGSPGDYDKLYIFDISRATVVDMKKFEKEFDKKSSALEDGYVESRNKKEELERLNFEKAEYLRLKKKFEKKEKKKPVSKSSLSSTIFLYK